MGRSTTEAYIYKIDIYLMNRHGTTAAERMAAPLKWYIYTGRASVQFIKALTTTKPYIIGRILSKMDFRPYDEIIKAIKAKTDY